MKMYAEEKNTTVLQLPINAIRPNPYQPRKEMDKEALSELCASIKSYGLMQPVVVRQINGCEYELIAGERRLRACRMADMSEISAVVVRAGGSDSAVMALIENIQRENLGYIEEAEAYCTLLSEHGMTQEELAERVGKKQSTVANKIRILKLSPQIRGILAENKLTERHARALLKLPNEKSRLRAVNTVVKKGLNVVKTEELVKKMLSDALDGGGKESASGISRIKDVRIFSNTIRQAVDMMKRSGIAAEALKTENEEYIEYTIKIHKNLKNAV